MLFDVTAFWVECKNNASWGPMFQVATSCCPFVLQHRRYIAEGCCVYSTLPTWNGKKFSHTFPRHRPSRFLLNRCQASFIEGIDSASIKVVIFNNSFKKIEEFLHSFPLEIFCLTKDAACGCLRLSCGCGLMNPQYHFLPVISLSLNLWEKWFIAAIWNVRRSKSLTVTPNMCCFNCRIC